MFFETKEAKGSKQEMNILTSDQEVMKNLRFFSQQDTLDEEDSLTLSSSFVMDSRKVFELFSKGNSDPLAMQSLEVRKVKLDELKKESVLHRNVIEHLKKHENSIYKKEQIVTLAFRGFVKELRQERFTLGEIIRCIFEKALLFHYMVAKDMIRLDKFEKDNLYA